MAKKGGENSKKAAGNARKAEAASNKKAAEDAKKQAQLDAEWDNGSKKTNSKKLSETAKKEEAARKKAEREALLKAEEETNASTKLRGADKVAIKKQSKVDTFAKNQAKKAPTISATGIDNALDALEISSSSKDSFGGGNFSQMAAAAGRSGIERHPERRFKAAIIAYEERRLPQLKEEHPGLRLNQYKDLIRKEFEKSPENPFNQLVVEHNATKDDVASVKQKHRKDIESRLQE